MKRQYVILVNTGESRILGNSKGEPFARKEDAQRSISKRGAEDAAKNGTDRNKGNREMKRDWITHEYRPTIADFITARVLDRLVGKMDLGVVVSIVPKWRLKHVELSVSLYWWFSPHESFRINELFRTDVPLIDYLFRHGRVVDQLVAHLLLRQKAWRRPAQTDMFNSSSGAPAGAHAP